MRKLRKMKGFTLIELMIVVAIIGILAAVAIPKFADLVTKSKEASTKGTLGSVRSAVSIYYGDNDGTYPTNVYDSLTTGNKYVPSVGGVATLGKVEIPKAGNYNTVGHTYNPVAQGDVAQGTTPNAGSDAEAFYYVNNNDGGQQGEIYIACSHKDTKNSFWTSY